MAAKFEEVRSAPRFVALGGVWLDEIRTDGKATKFDVLGGSVAFATLGARLFAATDPVSIRLICRIGEDDFPPEILETFRSWKIALTIHYAKSLPSARGIIQYDGVDESRRTYQRLTSPLLTTSEHLTMPDILNTTCFHLFETPDAAEKLSHDILSRREGVVSSRPLFIWEPQAKSCNTGTLSQHIKAARDIDVFSPNNAELASLFEKAASATTFDRSIIEAQARHFIDAGVGTNKKGCVVVRCAEHGCLVMVADSLSVWIPAFFSAGSQQVVDATGGGNAFLGGFAIGYQESGDFCEAAKYGNVAASFVIEQVGAPKVSGEGADELWNGERVRDRLAVYEARLSSA